MTTHNFSGKVALVTGVAAGIGRARTASTTEEDWDRNIAINLKGVWLCMKYEIPEMLIGRLNR